MFIFLGAIRQNRERAALYFDFVQHKSGSRSASLVVWCKGGGKQI